MSSLNIFKKVAVAEGISYLLLLFVAMPLKYFANLPQAVKYTGWAHGILFIAYFACLVMVWQDNKLKITKVLLIAVAALLPFAPFFVDRNLKQEPTQ